MAPMRAHHVTISVLLAVTLAANLGRAQQPAELIHEFETPDFGAGSGPNDFVPMGEFALFRADSPGVGPELWRSDGTVRGTRLVRDTVPGPAGCEECPLTLVGESVVFFIGNSIWRSDGTAGGTIPFSQLEFGETFDNEFRGARIGNVAIFPTEDLL